MCATSTPGTALRAQGMCKTIITEEELCEPMLSCLPSFYHLYMPPFYLILLSDYGYKTIEVNVTEAIVHWV